MELGYGLILKVKVTKVSGEWERRMVRGSLICDVKHYQYRKNI